MVMRAGFNGARAKRGDFPLFLPLYSAGCLLLYVV